VTNQRPSSKEEYIMGDHLALLVDRLLTESTLEAAIESRKRAQIGQSAEWGIEHATSTDASPPSKMVECRICHDEDFDSNMEIPCSCCGSLKYAHRKCVQRGSWEISRRDVHDSQVITMVPSELGRVNSDSDYDNDNDDYSYLRSRSTACCRSVAVIVSFLTLGRSATNFMVLLVLRHSLPFVISGAEQYSFALFSLLVLRIGGVLFPVFVMVRALATFHRRRRQQ
ncbi:hypothetical protein ACMD2_20332, partial [Ananas comosus]